MGKKMGIFIVPVTRTYAFYFSRQTEMQCVTVFFPPVHLGSNEEVTWETPAPNGGEQNKVRTSLLRRHNQYVFMW